MKDEEGKDTKKEGNKRRRRKTGGRLREEERQILEGYKERRRTVKNKMIDSNTIERCT